MIKHVLCGVAIVGVMTGPVFADGLTREDVQRRIRDVISEEEFERMQEIRRRTGQTYSEIFDTVIEPDREDDAELNRSSRRYLMSDDNRRRANRLRRSEDQLSIDVNVADPAKVQEKPLSVKEDPKPRRRQGIYTREGKRFERPPEEPEKARPGGIPASAVRARAMAARAEEDAAQQDDPERRRSFLYSSSNRSAGDEEPDKVEVREAVEDKYDSGFGADVLGKGENKIFGEREDRFKGFGAKKSPKRKMFRSGTIENEDRRKSMFGDDDQ